MQYFYPSELRKVAFIAAACTGLFGAKRDAHAQQGESLAAYCDLHESKVLFPGSAYDAVPERSQPERKPSCLMTSDAELTSYQCSCVPDGPEVQGDFATQELVPKDDPAFDMGEALETKCQELFHGHCGPFPEPIEARCDAFKLFWTARCKVVAKGHKAKQNRYFYFEASCEEADRGWAIKFSSEDPTIYSPQRAKDLCEQLVHRDNRQGPPHDLKSRFTRAEPSEMRVDCHNDHGIMIGSLAVAYDDCNVQADGEGAVSSCVCRENAMEERRRAPFEVLTPIDLPSMYRICRQEADKCQALPGPTLAPCSVSTHRGQAALWCLVVGLGVGLVRRKRQPLA